MTSGILDVYRQVNCQFCRGHTRTPFHAKMGVTQSQQMLVTGSQESNDANPNRQQAFNRHNTRQFQA